MKKRKEKKRNITGRHPLVRHSRQAECRQGRVFTGSRKDSWHTQHFDDGSIWTKRGSKKERVEGSFLFQDFFFSKPLTHHEKNGKKILCRLQYCCSCAHLCIKPKDSEKKSKKDQEGSSRSRLSLFSFCRHDGTSSMSKFALSNFSLWWRKIQTLK